MDKFVNTNRHLEERINKLPKEVRDTISVYNGKLVRTGKDGLRTYIMRDPDKYLDDLEGELRVAREERIQKQKQIEAKKKAKLKRQRIILRNRVVVGAAALITIAMAGAAIKVGVDYNKWKKEELDKAGYTTTIEPRTGFDMIVPKSGVTHKAQPDVSFGAYFEENGLFLDSEDKTL